MHGKEIVSWKGKSIEIVDRVTTPSADDALAVAIGDAVHVSDGRRIPRQKRVHEFDDRHFAFSVHDYVNSACAEYFWSEIAEETTTREHGRTERLRHSGKTQAVNTAHRLLADCDVGRPYEAQFPLERVPSHVQRGSVENGDLDPGNFLADDCREGCECQRRPERARWSVKRPERP